MDNIVVWAQEIWELYLRDFLLYLGIIFLIIESTYQRVKVLWEPKYQERGRWQDEIGPMIVALIVILSLWPRTMFDYLPFKPRWQIFSILWTMMLGARAASGAHEMYKRVVEIVQSLSTRIRGMWGNNNNPY